MFSTDGTLISASAAPLCGRCDTWARESYLGTKSVIPDWFQPYQCCFRWQQRWQGCHRHVHIRRSYSYSKTLLRGNSTDGHNVSIRVVISVWITVPEIAFHCHEYRNVNCCITASILQGSSFTSLFVNLLTISVKYQHSCSLVLRQYIQLLLFFFFANCACSCGSVRSSVVPIYLTHDIWLL